MVTFKKIAWTLALMLGLLSVAPVLAQTVSAGQLINLNGTVYLVGTTGLYGFPNLATFNSWGFSFGQLTTATSAEAAMPMLGLVPTMQAGCSTPLNQINGNCSGISGSVRVGQLININSTVYYVSSNGLYGFPNAATFYSWNYVFSQIAPANTAEAALPVLGLVPTMQPGCSNPQVQINANCSGSSTGITSGSLINQNGTIYLVGSNGLYGFPNAATFYSWGFNFSQIVASNSSESGLPVLGLVPSKNSNCGTPLIQISGNCSPAEPIPTPTAAAPVISGLNPSSGATGSMVTINGSGFTATNNTITFGIGSFSGYTSSNGTSISFTIPTSLAPTCTAGTACPQFIQFVNAADYSMTVKNSSGTSNSVIFTVTSTSTSSPSISSLTPSTGPIGTTVIINGTGFTSTGNKIMFGNSGSQYNSSYNLNSTDGKTITFTVPSSNYYACQATAPACLPPNTIIQPGTYNVSVANVNGTSNSLNFTVTQ